MPTLKVDGNQWFQWLLITITGGALTAAFAMWNNVSTINIERKQDSQIILELKATVNILNNKISDLSQEQALLKHSLRVLARTKGMDGMIKFNDPQFIDPSHEKPSTAYQSRVASDCEGKECYPPVPPPQPRPDSEPTPSSK